MLTFLLWIILFIICWPIALIALILYPIVWLLLLPFRLLGFAVDLSFDLVRNLFMLPFQLVEYSALIPLLQRQVLCVDTTASTPSTLR